MSANESEKESHIELPYTLIDIREDSEQFIFSFKCFDNRAYYPNKDGRVTGIFEVSYNCCGISSQFECDVTIGNLYAFLLQLENVYECLPGIEPVAVLENYGSINRTKMTFSFDKKGHVAVSGRFMNGSTRYNSGIIFEMKTDTSCISDILNNFNCFFDDIKRIQGHSDFL